MTLTERYDLSVTPRPDWSPSGNTIPTPGEPAVIATAVGNVDYHAFPTVVVIGTTMHMVYFKGGSHTDTDAQLVYATKALGGAWTAGEVAVDAGDHAGERSTAPSLHYTPAGDVLLLYCTINTTTFARTNRWKVRTGGTWGASSVMTTDFPSGQVTVGGDCATWDTTVAHAVYARTGGSGLRGAYLYLRDNDTGAWTQHATIVTPGFLNKDWEEPSLVKRADGLAMCFIRDDVAKDISLSWSPDLTRWSYPVKVFDGYGMPMVGQNPDDDMLCITRHPVSGRAVWSFSSEQGRPGSWTAIDYVDAQTGAMQYGSVVWVPGRGWVGVYGVAGDISTAEEYNGPSDLFEVDFT